MKEIRKDIAGYEGRYQISSYGYVVRLPRKVVKWNRHTMITIYLKELILQGSDRRGYAGVNLFDGHTFKTFSVHRLVAEAFVPNPHNYQEINHKDENKRNNRADNLEWCDEKYNMNYGSRIKRSSITRRTNDGTINRVIVQLTLDGKEVARYATACEAEKATGVNNSSIMRVCVGLPKYINKTAGGFLWRYEYT